MSPASRPRPEQWDTEAALRKIPAGKRTPRYGLVDMPNALPCRIACRQSDLPLPFAGDGKVEVYASVEPVENINCVFRRICDEKIDGRAIMNALR